MADYALTAGNAVVRIKDMAVVSADPLNADWRDYQDWLAAGGVPDPADPISELAIIVSPYQARVALLNANLLDTVEGAINTKGGAVKIKWEYATEVRSDDADLLELATELGIAARIPALFAAAQQIT